MRRFLIERLNDVVEVAILRNKEDDTFSFVNITKGHICPCKFSSMESAIEDMTWRCDVIAYEEIPSSFNEE